MITRGTDIITDTTDAGGAYGPSTETRTHKIVIEGSYQPLNYTYLEFVGGEAFANYCKPKSSTASTAMFPWATRSQEIYRVIQPVTASHPLIYAEYMSTAPTATDGWWSGGVVSIYSLVCDTVTWPLDEHHAWFCVPADDLSLPSWVCWKPIAHFIPGYYTSGSALVSEEEPTDSRAVAFPHRFPYTDAFSPFGGYEDKRAPLAPARIRYNMSLVDGSVYAPLLTTNSTGGENGPMWWGIPEARLQVYGVTYGNDGSGGGIPGSYTITLRGEDRDGGTIILQTWSGDVPVVQYNVANDRSAIGLDITLTPSVTIPDDRYVVFKYSQSVQPGDVPHYVRLHVPFTPALHPGLTSPAVTGDFIPVGWMMKVKGAI